MDHEYSDDEEIDVPAPFTDDIIEEFGLDSKLKTISLFKNLACKEPSLYGLYKLSDFSIFDTLEKCRHRYNNIMTPYEIELFEDLFVSIYGVPGNILIYNDVYYNLIKKTTI